ncbi:MAG: hypothetical protein HIU82_02175 [Proteobacteria bacterium]|nr:hypothetical protein [Pseudomonadota bacterium]
MTSPILYEGRHTGGFLISEANGHRSRGTSTITNSGGTAVRYQAGTVMSLGLGTPTATKGADDVGNGTIGTPTALVNAMPGDYLLEATSSTVFEVTAPNGDILPNLTVGTAYANQIGISISAGGTAWAVGDTIVVNVPAAVGASTYTGAAPANAVLWDEVWVDPGATVQIALIIGSAEVTIAHLVWDPAVAASVDPGSAALQTIALSELAALGIIGR